MRPTTLFLAALLVLPGPAAFTASASAQLDAGDVLVVDGDVPPVSTGMLFRVDAETGARTVLSTFGAGNPTAVAIEADADVLVTDVDAGTDPAGGTSEWGALYRLSPDPVAGGLARTILTDFGVGAATGRTPRAVAVEADGGILVINGAGGTGNRAVLVRVDPHSGARAVVSDFGAAGQGSLGVEPRGVAVESDGQILVIDAQAGIGGAGSGQGELVRIDPQTGMRTSVSNFGSGIPPGSNPTSLAVESDGQVLVSDEGHPSTTPLGLLFRVDPQSGARSILSDFNLGANTGREPEGVAIERDGQILVVDKHAGPFTRGMLFRVDPATGARTVVSDFGAGANQGGDPLALAVVPPTRGTLEVVTEVVNDDGGNLGADDVAVQVQGDDPTPAEFLGAGAPGTTVTLRPGGYDVSISPLPGYSASFSPGCGGIIVAGGTRACRITLDDDTPRLAIVSEVVNDDGGTAPVSDWTVEVTGADPVPATFPGAPAPGVTVTLDAGAYSVSADGPAGYDSTRSAGCAGTIGLGETRACTIAHDDRAARLTVIHEVINDNGGTLGAGDFLFEVVDSGQVPIRFPGEGPPGTTVTIRPGDFRVERIDPGPLAYFTTGTPGCLGPISLGEHRTCTVTSDDIHAALTVFAEVVNDDGGSALPGDFSVTVTARNPWPASFPGAAQGTSVVLDAGSYSVAVTGPAGYATSLSPGCAGDLGPAQSATCTITADDQPPAGPTCDGKAATIVGSDGPSELLGTPRDDVIVDLHGRNTVRGRGGDDTVCTGPGDDTILLGAGADTVIDAGGRNRVEGAIGRDAIATGAGDDTIDGGAGFDRCTPGAGANRVTRCEAVG